jgi:hypothetical protein
MRAAIPLVLAIAGHLPFHVEVRAQDTRPGPAVVHTRAEWDAVLAAGQPTPLDALTPYGKRRFIRGLRWGERGIGGFSTAPLTRELTPEQLQAVLHFVDSDEYLPMLSKDLAGPPLRLPAPSAEIERRLEQLEQFDRDDSRRRENAGLAGSTLADQAVLQRYRELFGERMGAAALRRQPTGDLLPLFDAAALADFKSPDSPAFADLLLVHAELAARGIDTRRTLDDSMLRAMLAARRFEQARAFAAARQQLAHRTVPHVVDALGPGFKGRSEFRYDAASATLTRVAAPPPKGTELLMIVGAGCHFSANALDAIAGDTALKARLREAGLTLVVPPHSPIPFEYITDWNAAHPDLPIRIPAYAQEWQAIAVLGTPEFYLLKDGKVIGKRSGWPAEGNRTALLELLDAGRRQK